MVIGFRVHIGLGFSGFEACQARGCGTASAGWIDNSAV